MVVQDGAGRILARVGKGIGVATNNVAEYLAAIEGLEQARRLGAVALTVRSDSKLLVEQLSGRWRVKNPTLIRLHEQTRRLLGLFDQVAIEHVPREFNREADRMANQGVDEWLAGEGKGYRPSGPAPALFDQDLD